MATPSSEGAASGLDEVAVDVAAPPAAVYALVADITNMGRWSPETYRCEWVEGATEAAVGARFKGWNRDKLGPLPIKWATTCTVAAATPGEEFAFTVADSGATWTYRFAPTHTGTRLTETRRIGPKPMLAKLFNVVVPRRDEKVRAGMQRTVERIRAAAEAG